MQRVAECGDLTQNVTWSHQGTRGVPGSPLVDHELRSMLRIILFHGLPVLLDHCLSAETFPEDGIPFLGCRLLGNDLGVPEVGIEVQRETIRRFTVHRLKETRGPTHITVA